MAVNKKKTERQKTEWGHSVTTTDISVENNDLHLAENDLDIVFILDTQLRFTFLNNAGCLVSGYDKTEIKGVSLGSLLSPGNFDLAKYMFQKKPDRAKLTRYELDIYTKTATLLNLEIQTQLITEGDTVLGIQGKARDITEIKRTQQILNEKIGRLSDIQYGLDKVAVVSISDKDGVIRYVNNNFCLCYGYSAEEIIGMKHSIINSGRHPASFWENFWTTIKAGKIFKAEVCNKSKDGNLHWADTTVVPFMDSTGAPYQYMAIRTDITEYHKLEMELAEKKLNDQKYITEITIAAQEKERQELSRELHDNVNQILATAKMYLGLAKAKTKTKEDLIGMSYGYVNEAIEALRSLSHSLAAPSLGDISLHQALEELVNILNIPDGIKVQLINDINEDRMIDEKQELMLYRVVQEQMNNIGKYAHAAKVVIHLKIEGKQLCLSITDDGAGFDTSLNPQGIGLKNIQSRVEFYDGITNIISAPGKGCKLEIKIPF